LGTTSVCIGRAIILKKDSGGVRKKKIVIPYKCHALEE